MKNPNGYGGITKLSGNRRNPYRVRVTDHWEVDAETGRSRQVFRTVGYYATKEEALEALNMYHQNPVVMQNRATFTEVYETWSAEKFRHVSKSSIQNYTNAYKSCETLHGMRFSEIRTAHLQQVIDTCGKNYPTITKIKILFNQLYEYAMQHDVCLKDYSEYVDIEKYRDPDAEDKHKAFTREEVKILWENADRSRDVRVILMLICSGVRIGELLDLKKENVNLTERYFKIKKAKTKAGIRIVPIAECVADFWRELMEGDGSFVIPNSRDKNRRMMYASYLNTYFLKSLEQLGIGDHFPHDTRHTFVSVMTSAGIQPAIIKRIVGHKGKDVTERVYTHFEIEDMIRAVNTPDFHDPNLCLISVL